MLSLLIGLLGYWMGPEGFGFGLINAVESINTLYWIIGVIVGIIMAILAIVMIAGGGAMGAGTNTHLGTALGMLAGGLGSALLIVVAFVKIALMIVLTDYLAGSLDPLMTNLDGLTNTQIIAFVVVLVLPFTGGNSSSSKS